MRRWIAAVLVVLAAPAWAQAPAAQTPAGAQPADQKASLSWDAPTQNEDGSALTDLAGFKIYRSTEPGKCSGSPMPLPVGCSLLMTLGKSEMQYVDSMLMRGTAYYYAATAFNLSAAESKFSNEATLTTPVPVPEPPSMLTATVTAADTTAYKMRQSVDGVQFVAFGTVPAGTACDVSHSFDGYRPIPRSTVKMASAFDTLPLVAFARCSG